MERFAGVDVNWITEFLLLPIRGKPYYREVFERFRAAGAASLPSFDGPDATASLSGALGGLSRSGSNALAVSGGRSATGGAILANDPHVAIMIPNSWIIVGCQLALVSRRRHDVPRRPVRRHRPQRARRVGRHQHARGFERPLRSLRRAGRDDHVAAGDDPRAMVVRPQSHRARIAPRAGHQRLADAGRLPRPAAGAALGRLRADRRVHRGPQGQPRAELGRVPRGLPRLRSRPE